MNYEHLHLLLNHFPIIGSLLGLGLFLVSFVGQNQDLRRASYIVFAGIALLTIPAFMTGFAAQQMLKGPGISDALIRRHESSALLSLWFVEITGTLALIGLWQSQRTKTPPKLECGRGAAFFAFERGAHLSHRVYGRRNPSSRSSLRPGGKCVGYQRSGRADWRAHQPF